MSLSVQLQVKSSGGVSPSMAKLFLVGVFILCDNIYDVTDLKKNRLKSAYQNIVSLSAGRDHSILLANDGQIHCFGNNEYY